MAGSLPAPSLAHNDEVVRGTGAHPSRREGVGRAETGHRATTVTTLEAVRTQHVAR